MILTLANTLEAKNALLNQLDNSSPKVETLKKQLVQTHTNVMLESKKASSLATQLEAEQKRSAKLEAKHAATLKECQKMGIKNFLKSQDFLIDLAILNTPILQHGCSSALQEVRALKLPSFNLRNFSSYNPKEANRSMAL